MSHEETAKQKNPATQRGRPQFLMARKLTYSRIPFSLRPVRLDFPDCRVAVQRPGLAFYVSQHFSFQIEKENQMKSIDRPYQVFPASFFFHASNLRFRHFSTNCAGFRGTWVTQPECYWILMGGTGFFFVCGRSDRVRFRNAADTILKQKKKKKKINKARKDWPLKREKLPKSRDWRGRPCRSRRKRRFVSATAVFYVPFFTFVSLGGWLWLLAVDRWRFRCRWVWKWLVWVEKEKEEEADARLRKMKFDEEARSSSVPLSAASDWLIPLRPIGSKPIQHVGRQGGTKRIRLNWIKVKLSPVDRRPNSVRASFFSRSSSFLGRNTMKVGHFGATQLKIGKKRKRRRRRSETR